jgi:hypothetical protein
MPAPEAAISFPAHSQKMFIARILRGATIDPNCCNESARQGAHRAI